MNASNLYIKSKNGSVCTYELKTKSGLTFDATTKISLGFDSIIAADVYVS